MLLERGARWTQIGLLSCALDNCKYRNDVVKVYLELGMLDGELQLWKLNEFMDVARWYNDWEFFELIPSAAGTKINVRGSTNVVNQFGGNCLTCHAQAEAKWDMICEQTHGCTPIPVTPVMAKAIQNTDPRCPKVDLPPEQRLRTLIRRIVEEYADAQHAHAFYGRFLFGGSSLWGRAGFGGRSAHAVCCWSKSMVGEKAVVRKILVLCSTTTSSSSSA